MSEGAKKYGWHEIIFADGTEVAFCPHHWDNARQRHVPADASDPNGWSLYGGGGGDREALENLIARAHAEFSGDQRYRIVKKLARRKLNELKSKEWDQVLRGPIREWAYSKLEELKEGCDCVDNDRVALRGNTAQMRRYNNQKARGCCGFHDSEAVCPIDGKTYLLGFNFGH